jgi:uncharacterized oxidoreductase
MPTIDAARLESRATRIFAAMGAPADDAAWIAALLVRANLRGHDSHGVIRIPQYWESVKRKEVDPTSPVTVTLDTPTVVRLDGGRGFGQVVARRGMEMAIARARAGGLSAVSMSHTSHVGRLSDYAEMAAAANLVGLVWANCVHGLNVAPWGGAARRLGTNPHAVAIPGAAGPAMVLDFATSVVAEGKLRVKRNRKQPAPPGWFVDAKGRPETDPEIFYGDPPGALLTAGDHKGYGLSLAVEILGGILSGTGPAGPPPVPAAARVPPAGGRALRLGEVGAARAGLHRDPDPGRAGGPARGGAPPDGHPHRGSDLGADRDDRRGAGRLDL